MIQLFADRRAALRGGPPLCIGSLLQHFVNCPRRFLRYCQLWRDNCAASQSQFLSPTHCNYVISSLLTEFQSSSVNDIVPQRVNYAFFCSHDVGNFIINNLSTGATNSSAVTHTYTRETSDLSDWLHMTKVHASDGSRVIRPFVRWQWIIIIWRTLIRAHTSDNGRAQTYCAAYSSEARSQSCRVLCNIQYSREFELRLLVRIFIKIVIYVDAS